MFQERIKRAISIVLVVGMIICSNGFTTLAQGASESFDEAHKGGSQSNPINYYYQYQEELNGNGNVFGEGNNSINDADADDRGNGDEKENIVLDGNEEDSSNKQKLNDGQSSDNAMTIKTMEIAYLQIVLVMNKTLPTHQAMIMKKSQRTIIIPRAMTIQKTQMVEISQILLLMIIMITKSKSNTKITKRVLLKNKLLKKMLPQQKILQNNLLKTLLQ